MTADDTKGALSYAWDLINAREEVSVKISDIHVPTFLCVNACIWIGSSLFSTRRKSSRLGSRSTARL
jgi:hypothetical protein